MAHSVSDIVRLPLSVLQSDPKSFVTAMEERGFVVLCEIGKGEEVCADAMAEFRVFCAGDNGSKKLGTSKKVYRNERGVPMWYAGFEAGDMREAFRVCTGAPNIESWPSEAFETKWRALADYLQDLCDECLSAVEGKPVSRPSDPSDDKSVAYSVHYPNDRGGQQAEGINIKAHVDPSLFVAEPVAEEPGLDVFDAARGRWLGVEAACCAGREIVVFGGQALERATAGRIKALQHRVSHRAGQGARFVFLFEQKYAAYFPEPAFDD